MEGNGLAKWRERLYSRVPLLGGWLRRGAVRRLVEADSPEAVRLLAEAVARTDDLEVRILALEALQEVERPRCVEAVCAAWAATRDVYLEGLLTIRGWGEKALPAVRVLYLLVKGRAEALTNDGADIVEPLLRACQDADANVAARARQVLGRLQNPAAKDALCAVVIDLDDALARAVALAAGYAPRDAGRRALFYFLTEQWAAYDELDFDHGLLRAAYQAADAALRQRIAAKARQAGRVEWVEVVTGGRQSLRLGEMTEAEWQTTLDVLVERRQWSELWRLAQEAPPCWSVRLLQTLPVNALPADRDGLNELLHLAGAWMEPNLSSLIRPSSLGCAEDRYHVCLAISPESQLLATGDKQGSISLWSLPEGRFLRTLEGHQGVIHHLAISPRGKVLISGDDRGVVRFWGLPGGEPFQTLVRPAHAGRVSCLEVSPKGKIVASGGVDGTIRLWNLADGHLFRTLKEGGEAIRCLTVSPDGHLLASGDAGGTLTLWNLTEGSLLQRRTDDSQMICLALTPDGCLLASGGYSGCVRLWSLPEGALLQTLKGHVWSVDCLAVDPSGQFLASGGRDTTVRLWGLPEGRPLHTLAGHTELIWGLAFSSDGRVLASSSYSDQIVELWSVPDGHSLRTLQGAVGPLATSADGQLLAGVGKGRLQMWIAELVRLGRIPSGKMSPQDLAWAQQTLRESTLTPAERASLEFIVALVRHRRRFDIHLDERPQRIAVGAFDIEIAG